MMEDMQVRNLSRHTQDSYLLRVSQFGRRFTKSSDLLGPGDDEQEAGSGSVQATVAALRFLYRVTLGLDCDRVLRRRNDSYDCWKMHKRIIAELRLRDRSVER
jgi:hypothetical protein